MTWAVGSDHAGFELADGLSGWLAERGNRVIRVGAEGKDPYDYPDAADALAPIILSGQAEFGILVCGSGIGICIRANRHPGIRAAQVWNEETAALAREHNQANVICLGARLLGLELAKNIVESWVGASVDRADRHVRRVQKLDGPLELL